MTPDDWTEADDFAGADLLLPNFGDPEQPLEGEPGGRLQTAARLRHDEAVGRAEARPAAPHAPLA